MSVVQQLVRRNILGCAFRSICTHVYVYVYANGECVVCVCIDVGMNLCM